MNRDLDALAEQLTTELAVVDSKLEGLTVPTEADDYGWLQQHRRALADLLEHVEIRRAGA